MIVENRLMIIRFSKADLYNLFPLVENFLRFVLSWSSKFILFIVDSYILEFCGWGVVVISGEAH